MATLSQCYQRLRRSVTFLSKKKGMEGYDFQAEPPNVDTNKAEQKLTKEELYSKYPDLFRMNGVTNSCMEYGITAGGLSLIHAP